MKPLRMILAEIGDGDHQRGPRNLAKALRDKGFEIIPLGLGMSAAQVAQAAAQEDIDGICLWLISECSVETLKGYVAQSQANFENGASVYLCGEITGELQREKWSDAAPVIFAKDESASDMALRIEDQLKGRAAN